MIPWKKCMLFILLVALGGLTSCSSNDDDVVTPIDDPIQDIKGDLMGSFTLPYRPLIDDKVFVQNLTMPSDGWIVVRRDNGENQPIMSEIISIPSYVVAGTYPEHSIDLLENSNLKHEERLWVNIHDDNGDKVFSYNGSGQEDIPLGIFDPFAGYIMISQSFFVNIP